tara:strand:- start:57857 stop:59857 length:2001 start_codon:yes stop_codon:yes gene_type:complete
MLLTGMPVLSVGAAEMNKPIGMEEIVVVGEKTQRSLKDTVSSVSVISEETLNSMQHQSITDAVAEIANVVVLSGAVPDIRGVSGNGSAGGFNSISGGARARVSTLIDGVAEPFVADLTGDSGIWDIQQIEVYRGPQSTSNGRNSLAGSIYIKTKDPSFDWEGAVRLGYRNNDSYVDTAGVISGPIIEDTLAFRLSLQRLDAETITDETGFPTNPADYDLNEIRTNRVKGKLLWKPNDNIEALLAYSTNQEQGDTGRIFYEGPDFSDHNKLFFRDIENDSDTTSLTVNYEISDGLSLDLLFAVMDYEWGFDSYEATPAAQQQLAFDETNRTVDVKLNFGLNNDTWNGFVGLAYFDRDQDIESLGAFIYAGDDESDSKAIYGEVDYALSDAWKLTVGMRVQKETQLRNFTYAPIVAVLDQDDSITLPKLVLQYALSEQTTLAISARKGYNAAGGALNFTAQEYYFYDEEKVDTYEGSIRSTLRDGTVNLSANVFYNNYEGYQALSSTRFITNLDEVVTYGAELEVVARPRANIELNAGLGLLRSEIEDAGIGYPTVDGNDLNSAPEITANVGGRYWITDAFSVGLSIRYVDDYYGDFENTEGREAGGYTLTRFRANYDNHNWRISAFVNNLLDEDEYVTKEPVSGRYPGGYVSVVDPRNVGVSVTYTL